MHCWPRASLVAFIASIVVSLATAGTACADPDGPVLAAGRRAAAEFAVRVTNETQTAPRGQDPWIVRHPVLTGMLVGTATGAALSQVDAIGGANHDLRVAFLGTGVGAWGGLIASAVHKARAGERVGAGLKFAIIAGAVTLAVVPLLACYGAGGCGGAS